MKYKTVAIVLFVGLSLIMMMNYASIGESAETQQTYSTTRSIMDTTVSITVLSSNESDAHDQINRAFEKMDYVDELMNSYDNSSELSILNEQGHINNANPDIIYAISRSDYYSQKSQGSFDISILPLLDLWKSKFSPGGTYLPPTDDEINEVLQLVNYSAIQIDGKNISLEENMMLTLGGVAKGYAVDLAIQSLINDGVKNAFVNAGGDGRYIGSKENDAPWKVGLQNPDKSDDAITIINVKDRAVATSGNYERYFSDAAKVSHIADPRTGYPSQNLISATVIAETAMDADAFATAVFVMGEGEGMEMIESLEDIECLLITPDKRIIRSSGFSQYENN
ncbi:FAD:protein FMN transferase [Methanolobus sp. ZRKC3]|uniref:FAD:protein FMN transferase n=1 Tax=Methanolobus sp. ZRKC3 TaxID=3125786 RepID=UPI003244EACA